MPAWRALIAWQPQEPKFPIGTVADILLHAKPAASEEELLSALHSVDLDPKDLPHGLQSELGTVRQKLSIGQLRKIALARALLKPAALLILDEPTASVDDISEERIAHVLSECAAHGAMILLISHRELMIDASTRITHMGVNV